MKFRKNRNTTDDNDYNNMNYKRNKMIAATKPLKTDNQITIMIILIITSITHRHYNTHNILKCIKKTHATYVRTESKTTRL